MSIAILSISSCFDVDMNQLELLQEQGKIDFFEISADKTVITFYWRYLKVAETKTVSINRVKKFGGSNSVCNERASSAYLYYQDDKIVWIKP